MNNRAGSIGSTSGTASRKACGFTLLEVLVAVLVLSVGLLGLAGLQTYSLKNNHGAMLRSQAVALAYDALDRMRSHRELAIGGSSPFETDFDETERTFSCNPTSSSCSTNGDAVADFFVDAWKAEIARLPGGEGEIDLDNDGWATVRVRWADNRDVADSADGFTTFTVGTRL